MFESNCLAKCEGVRSYDELCKVLICVGRDSDVSCGFVVKITICIVGLQHHCYYYMHDQKYSAVHVSNLCQKFKSCCWILT